MSKAQQAKLNFDLSEKLADYLITHTDLMKKYTGYSFVVISSNNQSLNNLNQQLISDLLEEGKNVVKAIEPSKSSAEWKFHSVN